VLGAGNPCRAGVSAGGEKRDAGPKDGGGGAVKAALRGQGASRAHADAGAHFAGIGEKQGGGANDARLDT